MGEKHLARLYGTEQNVTVEDAEPIESAMLFEQLSSAVWSKRPKDWSMSYHKIRSELPLEVARDLINDSVRSIDPEMVITNSGRSHPFYSDNPNEKINLPPAALGVPDSVSLTVFNWDDSTYGIRGITLNDERVSAQFVDGHIDYSRELGVDIRYPAAEDDYVLFHYTIQRNQSSQGRTTKLVLTDYHSALIETGYEGNFIKSAEMTSEQELSVLRAFQQIGGIALK